MTPMWLEAIIHVLLCALMIMSLTLESCIQLLPCDPWLQTRDHPKVTVRILTMESTPDFLSLYWQIVLTHWNSFNWDRVLHLWIIELSSAINKQETNNSITRATSTLCGTFAEKRKKSPLWWLNLRKTPFPLDWLPCQGTDLVRGWLLSLTHYLAKHIS